MWTGNTSEEEVGGITTTVSGTATTETGITGTATTGMEATAIMAMGTATEAWPDTETADEESFICFYRFFAFRMEGQEKLNLILMKEVGYVLLPSFQAKSKTKLVILLREVTSDRIFGGPKGLKNDFT